MKIGTKLIVTLGTLIVVSMIALNIIIGFSMRNQAQRDAKEIARETALHHANAVKTDIDIVLEKAEALSDVFATAVNNSTVDISRTEANTILAEFIEKNPAFLGVYVGFEPNAFDGNDTEYRNAPGHDETGRYIPYFTLDTEGNAVLEPLLD